MLTLKKYNNTAPIVVEVSTINIPHHLPKTKPENIINGMANPSNNTQTMEKMKNRPVSAIKFSFL